MRSLTLVVLACFAVVGVGCDRLTEPNAITVQKEPPPKPKPAAPPPDAAPPAAAAAGPGMPSMPAMPGAAAPKAGGG